MHFEELKNYMKKYRTKKYTPRLRKTMISIEKPRKENMYNVDFSMAFVSKDKKQVAEYVGCRDYLHDQIRTHILKQRCKYDGHPYYPDLGDPKICMTKLQLLIKIDTINLNKFMLGLKALNNIETFAQIKKTKVYPAEYTDKTNKLDKTLLFISGDSVYMNNPHILSVLTLILRFFTLNKDAVYTHSHDLSKQYGNFLNSYDKDTHLMKTCYKYMHFICKERDYIFKDLNIKQLFPFRNDRDFHAKGGIEKLCLKDTLNETVNEKIKQLYTIID